MTDKKPTPARKTATAANAQQEVTATPPATEATAAVPVQGRQRPTRKLHLSGKSKPHRGVQEMPEKGNQYVHQPERLQQECLWHRVGASISVYSPKMHLLYLYACKHRIHQRCVYFMLPPTMQSHIQAILPTSITHDCIYLANFQHARILSTNANMQLHHKQTLSPPVFSPSGSKNPAFDSRILLIRAGDVETNPGPQITCKGCSKTIRIDQLRSSIICAICSSHFHKSHTDIKDREVQKRAAENPGSWTCIECRETPTTQLTATSSAHTRTQSTTQTTAQSTTQSTTSANALGSSSSTPPNSRPQADCTRPKCTRKIYEDDPRAICGSCSNSYHKSCTGLRLRLAQDAAANIQGSWTCPTCRGETTQEESSSTDQLKCSKKGCKVPIYTKYLYLTCVGCGRFYHKSVNCSGIEKRTDQDRAAREVDSWKCPGCTAAEIPDSIATDELGIEGKSNVKGFKEKNLRIMQWNADHMKSKLPELKTQLRTHDVDICMIQETKLGPTDTLPKIPGYTVIRHDRKGGIKGGGLVCLLKETISHAITITASHTATEVLGIKIKCQKKWLEIINVYCPPQNSLGQEIELATEIIPTSNNSIILGDFNAHSNAWDLIQPEDDRGDHLLDWIGSAELTILNDSHSSTRFSRTTGGLSSPDVTLAGSLIAPRCEWKILEAIGNSDHLPLLTTINLVIEHQHVLGSVPRWKRTGVDWPKWSEAVESLCQSEPPQRHTSRTPCPTNRYMDKRR